MYFVFMHESHQHSRLLCMHICTSPSTQECTTHLPNGKSIIGHRNVEEICWKPMGNVPEQYAKPQSAVDKKMSHPQGCSHPEHAWPRYGASLIEFLFRWDQDHAHVTNVPPIMPRDESTRLTSSLSLFRLTIMASLILISSSTRRDPSFASSPIIWALRVQQMDIVNLMCTCCRNLTWRF